MSVSSRLTRLNELINVGDRRLRGDEVYGMVGATDAHVAIALNIASILCSHVLR